MGVWKNRSTKKLLLKQEKRETKYAEDISLTTLNSKTVKMKISHVYCTKVPFLPLDDFVVDE